MNIGMTLPVMEPGLTRKDLETWTSLIDTGPWSHIALGERIVFPNPEFISTLSAVAAWTQNVEIIATVSVLSMHDPILCAKQFSTIDFGLHLLAHQMNYLPHLLLMEYGPNLLYFDMR